MGKARGKRRGEGKRQEAIGKRQGEGKRQEAIGKRQGEGKRQEAIGKSKVLCSYFLFPIPYSLFPTFAFCLLPFAFPLFILILLT
jgi:uncharacterized protein YjbJ (UPF0337 family)